jgi:chemotaxis protein methyltransferase CheR
MTIETINQEIDVLPFRQLLIDRISTGYKEDTLNQLPAAIVQRMELNQIIKPAEYFFLLQKDNAEFTRLVNLLTVNETYFMREQGHFNVLVNRLFPEFIKNRKGNEKFKILSAGCSSGEELYSALISLTLKFGKEILKTIHAEGIDIDSEILEKAKKGIYYQNSFRNVDTYFVDAFFSEYEEQYKINESFLGSVFFSQVNLTDSSFSFDSKWNVIFYRNVSIYFVPGIRKEIFKNLANALKEPGYLFTGVVETSHHNFGVLPLEEIDDHYLFNKESELFKKNSIRPDRAKELKRDLPYKKKTQKIFSGSQQEKLKKDNQTRKITKQDSHEEVFQKALGLAKSGQRQKALDSIEGVFTKWTPNANDYLLRANILVSLEKLDQALTDCLTALEIEEWNRQAYLLLGIISRLKKNIPEAVKRFKGAIYIESTCWLSHFYLAEIFIENENFRDAKREYGISRKLLLELGSSECGLMLFPLSFNQEQLVHHCERKLGELEKH